MTPAILFWGIYSENYLHMKMWVGSLSQHLCLNFSWLLTGFFPIQNCENTLTFFKVIIFNNNCKKLSAWKKEKSSFPPSNSNCSALPALDLIFLLPFLHIRSLPSQGTTVRASFLNLKGRELGFESWICCHRCPWTWDLPQRVLELKELRYLI